MSKIIETMKALGYPSNDAGVCYGIAHTAVAATLDNRLHQYLKVIAFIQNKSVDEIKELCKNAQYVAQINNETVRDNVDLSLVNDLSIERSEEEKMASFIKPYFDDISLYFGPDALGESDEVKNNLLSQITHQSYAKTQELFDVNERYYPQTVDICLFDAVDTLKQYVTDLANSDQKLLALTLDCHDHSVFVGYYNGDWYFINHDKVQISKDLTDELMQDIFKSMSPFEIGSGREGVFIEIQSYTQIDRNKPELRLENTYEINEFDKIAFIFDNSRLAMAMRGDHADIVDKLLSSYLNFIETISDTELRSSYIEMLLAKMSGVPSLYTALSQENILSADCYISKVLSSQLPEWAKVELLMARAKQKLPAVHGMLNQNSHKAMDLYLSHILNSDLSDYAKESLLMANINQGKSNISAISANLGIVKMEGSSKMEGVKKYIVFITQTDKLSFAQKQRIIANVLLPVNSTACKNNYCIGGLNDFVKEVVNNEQVRDLLLSNDALANFIDNPCFQEMITIFCNASKLNEQVCSIARQDPLLLKNTANLYQKKSVPDAKDSRIALLKDLKNVIGNREVSDTLKREVIQYIMLELKTNHKNPNTTVATACFNNLSKCISLEGTISDLNKAQKAINEEISRAESGDSNFKYWAKHSVSNIIEKMSNSSTDSDYSN